MVTICGSDYLHHIPPTKKKVETRGFRSISVWLGLICYDTDSNPGFILDCFQSMNPHSFELNGDTQNIILMENPNVKNAPRTFPGTLGASLILLHILLIFFLADTFITVTSVCLWQS